ncbi:MAG: sugar transferase [Acidimicrobiales bacterium]
MRKLARPLLYLGTLAIVVGLGRYHAQFIGHYVFHTGERMPWNLAYATVLCVAAYGLGLPDLDRRRGAWAPAIAAGVLGAGVTSAAQLVSGSVLLPRFVVFGGLGLIVPWFAMCVGFADIGRAKEEARDRVVLVAGADEEAALEAQMGGVLERPALLVGALTPSEAHEAGAKPLLDAVGAARGTVVVLDHRACMDSEIVAQAATLHESGLRVRSLSFFYDAWLGKLPLSELERMSLMFDVGELHRRAYGRMKRLVDVLAGVVGVGILAVAIPLVALGNLFGNRGPLFYRQPRVGKANKEFQILKFRTMRSAAGPSTWTGADDPRITPFGRFLRRTHVDELPQFINVLRGEQSLVGPRPEQTRYVNELREKIPYYSLRHLVRPGLTGWAQVKYPYGADETDALEKLQYEFWYLQHQSLLLDLRIIGRTIRSIVGRGGR